MTGAGFRIGIDVGGTNTDAAVLDQDLRVVAKAKVATTADVLSGVRGALTSVLDQPGVRPERVEHAVVGTTHATNALIELRRLQRVAVLRIGAPATKAIPPLTGWPNEARSRVLAAATIVAGGHQIDGRPIAPLDVAAIRRFAHEAAPIADGFAVVSVFSPVRPDDELAARELILAEAGATTVSLSHEIGTVGLVERENATVLNVALAPVAREVVEGVADALAQHRISAELFVAQNDGTLMSGEWARQFPVLMIGSGPASSIRGAAFLSGIADAIVADVGGTSTDIGAVTDGLPRASASPIEIGGIRAKFRMPDLLSVGIGGGTVIRSKRSGTSLGPDSVADRLTSLALVFGGSVPTLTDAAVAGARLTIGDPGRLGDLAMLSQALRLSDAALTDAFDRAIRSPVPLPVLVVGGGSALVPDVLPGLGEVHRPEHHEVANAVGAAIAFVGREIDEVIAADGPAREERLKSAMDRARQCAIEAGADPATVEVIDVQEHPLAYLPDPAVRVRVKAAGPLPPLLRR